MLPAKQTLTLGAKPSRIAGHLNQGHPLQGALDGALREARLKRAKGLIHEIA